MGVKVAKDAIDLGIVTTNGPAMLVFYRDVLGFVHEGDIAMEHVGIKVMHRLWFGKSLIKLVTSRSRTRESHPRQAVSRAVPVPLLDDDHP